MTTPQEDYWAGADGNAYQRRNRVDWRRRVPFWEQILRRTTPSNVLEVGCGPGWNLMAIRNCEGAAPFVKGCDVNWSAVMEAQHMNRIDVALCTAMDVQEQYTEKFELVFTAGMLIHIAREDLQGVMNSIIAASTRYVLAVEYEDKEEQEIEYRGQKALLWKRNYGALYEALGLKLIWSAPAGDGFDACTAWLMERP